MKYILSCLLAIAILAAPAEAHSPEQKQQVWPEKYEERQQLVASLVHFYAVKHGLPQYREPRVLRIMYCENRELDPTLQSRIIDSTGNREESYGLAQIHIPSHKFTIEQATDPHFSIDFMVRSIANGQEWMWACSRMVE